MPFVVGLVSLSVSTGLFALTRSLTVLVIARTLQGLSAAAVWTVGLSIIADNVPTERVGEAMSYTTVALAWGSLLGPAIGGVMYEKVGFYGAFIVPICLLAVDVVMRLAMIERKSEFCMISLAVYYRLLSTESTQVNDSATLKSSFTPLASKLSNDSYNTFTARGESSTGSISTINHGDEQAPLQGSSNPEVENVRQSEVGASATVFILLRSPRLPLALVTIVVISTVISSLDAVSEP